MKNEHLKLLILGDLYHTDESIKHQLDRISALNLDSLVYGDNPKYEWFDCIQEVKDRLLAIDISTEQLLKVTLLSNECCHTHFMVMPNWDGEGDDFDLSSLAGIEALTNLESMQLLDLSNVSDFSPLLDLNLQEVSDCSGLPTEIKSQLIAQGVDIS
jgi:hypothetical protein